MRKLLGSLIGLLLLLVVLEFGGRACAGSQLAASVNSKFDNASSVQVAAGDPPFLVYGLGLGYLKNGSFTVRNIVDDPVSISRLEVSAAKLRFSRSGLVGGSAKIVGDAPYQVVAVLDAQDLRRAVNAPVRFHGNYVQTNSAKGETINAIPKIVDDEIVLADESDPSVEVRVPMPAPEYLPCTPQGVGVSNAIVLGCVSDSLPEAMQKAAS